MRGRQVLTAIVSPVTLLFLILAGLTTVTGKRPSADPLMFLIVIALVWGFFVYKEILLKKKQIRDIAYGVVFLLIIWEILTRILDLIPKVLYPSPEAVFQIFVTDAALMLQGLGSSMFILAVGFAVALTFGNILGLFVGWNLRLRAGFLPVARVLSPIPAMIYTPYLIAILPSFTVASVTVVGVGLFWPTFMNMINRVASMDRRIIDSAKTMNVNTSTMLLKVILPYCLPGIIAGLKVQLSTTFMVLVMAEMIGSDSGLGFYIKKFSDYADYTRVAAGIIFIGLTVTVINILIARLEARVVKWRLP